MRRQLQQIRKIRKALERKKTAAEMARGPRKRVEIFIATPESK